MKDEITEKLVSSKRRSPEVKKNDKRSKVCLAFLMICMVVIIAAVGYFSYSYFQKSQIKRQLDIGNKYLDTGEYENAIISYKEIIDIDPKNIEAYKYLGQAYLNSGQIEEAQSAYEEISEITKDPVYRERAKTFEYGNTGGNITNGGIIAQQGIMSYFIQNNDSETEIWKFSEDSSEILAILPSSDRLFQTYGFLNIWKDQIYFVLGNTIQKMSINGGEPSTVVFGTESDNLVEDDSRYSFDQEGFLSNLMIYNDRLYYIKVSKTGQRRFILSSDLEGNDTQVVVNTGSIRVPFSFVIDNDILYYSVQHGLNALGGQIVSKDLSNGTTQTLYTGDTDYIERMSISGNILFFSTYVVSVDLEFPSTKTTLKKIDLSTGEWSQLEEFDDKIAVNSDSTHYYYTLGNQVFRSTYDGEASEIYTIPANSNVGSPYIKFSLNSLSLTSDALFETSSTPESVFDILSANQETYRTSIEDTEVSGAIDNYLSRIEKHQETETDKVDEKLLEEMTSENEA